MGAVSRGQKGAGRTPRSLRPEIRAGFIGHINNRRSASSPAEPSTTKELALPGGRNQTQTVELFARSGRLVLPIPPRIQARTFEGLARSSDRFVPSPAHGAPRNVALSTLRHSPRTRVVPRVPRPRNSRVATPEYRQADAARFGRRPPSGSTVSVETRLESVSSFGMVHRALGCAARPAPFLRLSL